MSDPHQQNSSNHWDKYWDGSQDAASFGEGGVNHPYLQNFWRSYFSITLDLDKQTKILDVASGTGAVLTASGLNPSEDHVDITCVDMSIGALNTLNNRYPDIKTLQCDAGDLPFDKPSFDIVCSQFGIEYAGLKALNDLVAFVNPGGQLALIIHHDASSIHLECANSAAAIEYLIESSFLSLAITMFRAGFQAVVGEKEAEFREAATTLLPVFKSLEPLMDRYGIDVAGNTISTLYNKVSEIQNNLSNYTSDEVIQWLEKMEAEMPAYAGRMRAMCNAAISPLQFKNLVEHINRSGFNMLEAHPVQVDENSPPIAWMIIAEKLSS